LLPCSPAPSSEAPRAGTASLPAAMRRPRAMADKASTGMSPNWDEAQTLQLKTYTDYIQAGLLSPAYSGRPSRRRGEREEPGGGGGLSTG
jgi:hypothetical protein